MSPFVVYTPFSDTPGTSQWQPKTRSTFIALGPGGPPEVLLVLVAVMLFMIPVIVYLLSVAQRQVPSWSMGSPSRCCSVPDKNGRALVLKDGFVWKCWVNIPNYSHLIGIMISKTIGTEKFLVIFSVTVPPPPPSRSFCIIFPIAFLFDEIFLCLKNAQPKLKLHHISSYFIIFHHISSSYFNHDQYFPAKMIRFESSGESVLGKVHFVAGDLAWNEFPVFWWCNRENLAWKPNMTILYIIYYISY